MSDLGAIDWAKVGGGITAIGIGIGGVYAWWLNQKRLRADVRADVAKSESEQVIARSEGAVYQMLLDRVATLESDMRLVRAELTTERMHSRRLVLHIWKLEGLMRSANLDVPPFVDEPPGHVTVTVTA